MTVWRRVVSSVTRSPNSSRTWSSSPHSGAGLAPGGGGGAYGFIVANSLPMKPSWRPVDHPDGAAGPDDADQLVGGRLVVRARTSHPHTTSPRRNCCRRTAALRRRPPPIRVRRRARLRYGGRHRTVRASGRWRSRWPLLAAAGMAALPEPAATSSTWSPARTPHARTNTGPSDGISSAATAG